MTSLGTNELTHDDVIKWKHFPRYWPFVRGIHRSPVNSQHKGQWRGALMFSLICVWINGWVNNREAGYLRRYRAHFDVIVINRCLHTKNDCFDIHTWERTLYSSISYHWISPCIKGQLYWGKAIYGSGPEHCSVYRYKNLISIYTYGWGHIELHTCVDD